jgi:AraC family transcriptional regulator
MASVDMTDMRTCRTTPHRNPRSATTTTYTERVNGAIDYVVSHLSEPVRLADVSHAAGMSPFHFHRVFQAMVGVTVADFVKRLRLDKSLFMMAHSRRSSFTQIALACGFSSSSDFSRSFKERFGAAPSKFDFDAWRDKHRSKLYEATAAGEFATNNFSGQWHLKSLPAAHNPDGFNVKIRALPARTVAYIRISDPYRPGAAVRAVERLIAWAERHSLADGQWVGYQWDNPEIVPLEDCHYHVAVEVPVEVTGEAERFIPRGEVGRFLFPPMTVAQVDVRGGIDLELRALHWLFGTWLPRSGYVPGILPMRRDNNENDRKFHSPEALDAIHGAFPASVTLCFRSALNHGASREPG